jgi:aldose 1-epimerase
MLPWAGRIRRGRFRFAGRDFQLPITLGAHAIHGVGFMLPWEIAGHSAAHVELTLALPCDDSWPFGGVASQRMHVQGRKLRLEMAVQAGRQPMPRPVFGWHPWFLKPDKLDFAPTHHYVRDAACMATTVLPGVPPAPWDDCFINTRPVQLFRRGQILRLASDCDHWLVFNERPHATCVEPQTGPPDAFNLRAGEQLEPGASITAWFELEWM